MPDIHVVFGSLGSESSLSRQSVQVTSFTMNNGGMHSNTTNGVEVSCPAPEGSETTALSTWDQSTTRFHVRIAALFPLDDSNRDSTEKHLNKAVRFLSKNRPEFTGRIHPGERKGWVYLTTNPEWCITIKHEYIDDEFPLPYEQLKNQHFPAEHFVHTRFDFAETIKEEVQNSAPVVEIRAFYIQGGLILAFNFNHAFGDGVLLKKFLDSFAAATRGEKKRSRGNRDLNFARADGGPTKLPCAETFESLLKECHEITRLEAPTGPNQPTFRGYIRDPKDPEAGFAKSGRIFVFGKRQINQLKKVVLAHEDHAAAKRPPSTYTCLATLMWIHSAKARLDTEKVEECWGWGDAAEAKLSNPVNWRPRAFQGKSHAYFGNAVTLAQTRVATETLLHACTEGKVFALLVREVEKSIRGVDEPFVRQRIELIEACPDPRMLGLDMDSRIPQDLAFNTWREFGADTIWNLGDTNLVKPDCLRRTQPNWNMGGTLILPAKEESDEWEVLLTIPQPAMNALRKDPCFMKWVLRDF